MPGEITTFANLPVGSTFWWGGNVCVKRTNRTAQIGNYGWFYFRLTDVVTQGAPA